jgi:hypothetical protein
VLHYSQSSAALCRAVNISPDARPNVPKPAFPCPNLPPNPFHKIKAIRHFGAPHPSNGVSHLCSFAPPLLCVRIIAPSPKTPAHHSAPSPRHRNQQKPTPRHISNPFPANRTHESLWHRRSPARPATHPNPHLPLSNPTFMNFTPTNRLTFRPLRRIIVRPCLFKGQQHSRQRRRSELMPQGRNGLLMRIL